MAHKLPSTKSQLPINDLMNNDQMTNDQLQSFSYLDLGPYLVIGACGLVLLPGGNV